MAITFPASPADGATYTNPTTGVQYIYNATDGVWKTNVWPTNTDYLQLTGGTLTGALTTTGLTVSNSVALPNSVITRDNLATTAKGSILQVVQTEIGDAYSVTSTSTEATLAGFTLDITPSAASSKILIMVTVQVVVDSSYAGHYACLQRNNQNIFVGPTPGNKNAATISLQDPMFYGTNAYGPALAHFSYLDSPNSTSSVNYRIVHADTEGITNVIYVNRSKNNTNTDSYSTTSSSMIAMEVAA